MTTLLADIKPWEGHIVPGILDPRYRQGPTVNLQGKSVKDPAPPPPQPPAQPKPGLGDNGEKEKGRFKI